MKHSTSIFAIAMFAALLLVPEAHAQEEPQEEAEDTPSTQFVMFNQNKCPGENMERVMELVESNAAPILRELEEEGEIATWGILRHAWGDEYNFNWYIITDSHRDFVDAWELFVERSQERHPEAVEELRELCDDHKDNLYTLHRPGESGETDGQ